ncbi:RNaseH domain-containing protein [Crocosphaera sp. Alani8]|uniref:RNaseH domain-containing protein n=1 Tax=Crocosphaera sp. Alani8 TaxID=3038952 RepID=UPI00313C8F64
MDLAENAFIDLKIAVLMFPFSKEVQTFCKDIERVLRNNKVDVLLPNHKKWIPYTKAGIEIGQLFHKARKKDSKSIEQVQMKGGDLVKFVVDTLVNHLENPTITLIEADVWRNERNKNGNNNQAWFQLKNEYLLEQRDVLNFSGVPNHNYQYKRDEERLNNLLGVIRLRSGKETPQYVTNRQEWDEDSETEDFTKLSGFIDKTLPGLLHYFSIGRIPGTQKTQHEKKARNLGKTEREDNIYAANIAYKHQQMIEMLPFFVRNDLHTKENIKALCRVVHYLRTSPAHTKGNISHPYPMHIGNNLIEDMLCILGFDD